MASTKYLISEIYLEGWWEPNFQTFLFGSPGPSQFLTPEGYLNNEEPAKLAAPPPAIMVWKVITN